MRQLLRNLLAVGTGFCIGVAISIAIHAMAGLPFLPANGDAHEVAGSILASMEASESMSCLAQLAAHAIGTYCGAAAAAWLSASHSLIAALAIGFAFLSFGIANALARHWPLWFEIVDLNLAYIPMAWLGYRSVALVRRRAV